MSLEYLLVVYKQDRDVLADGESVGVTNHTILLAPDEYIITLSGDGYAPPSEDVVLAGTSIMRPKVVVLPELGSSVRAVVAGGLFALLAIVAAACETIPDYPNRPLAEGAANPPPANLIGPDPEAPLILIAFSGGGSRAAALGLGVLDELAAQTYLATDKPVALIDRVKVVSSVSGGNVIAAWFGAVGPARVDELKSDFLARDNMATLEWEAADPLTLARLSFSSYTRIDALRDLLDRELFHGARFVDLRRPGAPLVVMNATDMESGEVFAFTPQRFDDLCSDLDQLPLSVAVAASAAFPVALSPMSLRNYSYEDCRGAIPGGGWVAAELTLPLPRYLNVEEYKRARYANALRWRAGR